MRQHQEKLVVHETPDVVGGVWLELATSIKSGRARVLDYRLGLIPSRRAIHD